MRQAITAAVAWQCLGAMFTMNARMPTPSWHFHSRDLKCTAAGRLDDQPDERLAGAHANACTPEPGCEEGKGELANYSLNASLS